MTTPSPRLFLACLLVLASLLCSFRLHALTITDQQALSAGKKLWKNECDGQIAGLTSWNSGEDFASLGIGHYIWYPAGKRGPFEESFPDLLQYLQTNGVNLPSWLTPSSPCPWNTRTEFQRDQDGSKLVSLREVLAATVALQARFSADRLKAALPKMLNAMPGNQRERIERQFSRVAASPNGVYALVDYVNFKGEGVLATERYQGQGWGLLQVLAGMETDPDAAPSPRATQDFSASASRTLTRRVSLSPAERREGRWLPGWKNRVRTYAPAD